MKTLNGFYAEAEKIGGSSYLEGCLACATAYFIFLCMETHYEKVLRCGGGLRDGQWIQGWLRGVTRNMQLEARIKQQCWPALSVPPCADRS